MKKMLRNICKEYKAILTIEEGSLYGGFGSAVISYLNQINQNISK